MRITLVDFAALVSDFYNYMGRDKKPGNDRISIWYNIIRNTKATDITEAFVLMKDSLDSLPHNIPKAIKASIFQNNRSKPEIQNQKFEAHRYGHCDDCNGTGMFKLRINVNRIMLEPIQFCSRCDNYRSWTNSPGQRVSKYELEALNIRFKPYNKTLSYSEYCGPVGSVEDIKNMAIIFGERKRLNEGEKYQNRHIEPEREE